MTDVHLDPYAVHSIVETPDSSPIAGAVRWDPVHSIWNGAMMAVTVIAGPLTFSWSAATVFVVLTGGFLLLGHSVGFHRRMIHGSFQCPKWLEAVLIWCGTAVGMSGPLWMIRAHDLRDWAQRQPDCHPYLAHKKGMLLDAVWQMHCRLVLDHPPRTDFGETGRRRYIQVLERTWMLQQLPIALLLFMLGGWSWVVWGVCARVCASVGGHWFVGHLAHNRGPQSWLVDDAGVQAHDVPWAAIPTMGEAWHNNHHAYPASARIGLYRGQADWGFLFIKGLERLGLAWSIQTPDTLPARALTLCDQPSGALAASSR